MLVLTRREQEAIMIGDSIVVRVLEVRGDQVRLGIEAPKDVKVFREEVLQRVADGPRAAAFRRPATAGEVEAVIRRACRQKGVAAEELKLGGRHGGRSALRAELAFINECAEIKRTLYTPAKVTGFAAEPRHSMSSRSRTASTWEWARSSPGGG